MGFEHGHKRGGRPKGSKDRNTEMLALVKQVVAEEGIEGLRAFSKSHPADFWRIAAKLIPAVKEISGINGEAIEFRPIDSPPRPATYEQWLKERAGARLESLGIEPE